MEKGSVVKKGETVKRLRELDMKLWAIEKIRSNPRNVELVIYGDEILDIILWKKPIRKKVKIKDLTDLEEMPKKRGNQAFIEIFCPKINLVLPNRKMSLEEIATNLKKHLSCWDIYFYAKVLKDAGDCIICKTFDGMHLKIKSKFRFKGIDAIPGFIETSNKGLYIKLFFVDKIWKCEEGR